MYDKYSLLGAIFSGDISGERQRVCVFVERPEAPNNTNRSERYINSRSHRPTPKVSPNGGIQYLLVALHTFAPGRLDTTAVSCIAAERGCFGSVLFQGEKIERKRERISTRKAYSLLRNTHIQIGRVHRGFRDERSK